MVLLDFGEIERASARFPSRRAKKSALPRKAVDWGNGKFLIGSDGHPPPPRSKMDRRVKRRLMTTQEKRSV